MKQLSVCLPSNRGFEKSFRSIETALAFCETRDAVLIVSDNSGDVEKAAYWQGRSAHLLYLPDAPVEPNANAANVFGAVTTPFMMPMGDDDELHDDDRYPPVRFEDLEPDAIGIKPMTELFVPGTELSVSRAFGLEQETPGQRLREFFARNGGDNTIFYSIFRTEPYLSLRAFFLAHHPTLGSYCDWQMSMALLLAGKLVFDPSIVFRYNASSWDTSSNVEDNAKRLYTSVGLPENFRHYSSLLRAMDVFVFTGRKGGGLTREALADVQAAELSDLLNLGFTHALEQSGDSDPVLRELANKGRQERNPMLKFLHAAAALDCFQPGLKAKYIAFLKSGSA